MLRRRQPLPEQGSLRVRLRERWHKWRSHRRALRNEQLLAAAKWRDGDER
jgi:hypothetical protein